VAVTLGILIDELLDAKDGLREYDLFFVFGDHHLLVENRLKYLL